MKRDLTELVFILDRSGSMCGLEADTVGGYNALLARNRELPGEAHVTTVLFNHEVTRLHDHVPLTEVPDMALRDFEPCGCTALLDAVGETIADLKRTQRILPEECRAEHVLIAIATDGYENASRRYGYAQVQEMIRAAQARGWEVVFMAANIDAAAEAAHLGISPDRAVSYAATPCGTAVMLDAVCEAAACVRAGSSLDGWSERNKRK